MGKNISKIDYCPHDFNTFQKRIIQQLSELKTVMQAPTFGEATLKLGAELELYLVDAQGEVSLSNQKLLDLLNDEQFQPELNQYNLELNLSAFKLSGKPFSQLQQEINQKTQYLEEVASQHSINIIPIGILPTLRAMHLNEQFMTDIPRYHCLSNFLYQQRGEAFNINIQGDEHIEVMFKDICAEGANTSFQVHLMVEHARFKDIFNAAQLTTPLVLALAANSAIFLGKRAWDETRITLFKQCLDIRHRDTHHWRKPTRVNFGHGWVRNNAWELFAETVALYPPILPELSAIKNELSVPALDELSLHMGTVWPWNRPVYSNQGNGHIRIEFRALPAGPSVIDMVANAAFAIGLAVGLADDIEQYICALPFDFAEYNFYRAAKSGLAAQILWPNKATKQPEQTDIKQIIKLMIPIAKAGLAKLNVDNSDIEQYIAVIEQRLNSGVTGAIWQKKTLQHLDEKYNKTEACQQLVQLYLKEYQSGQPVAKWNRIWQ
jgi:gamma-glutamyl:cysteine ligase YbdK (ATP-grasp superfamily)